MKIGINGMGRIGRLVLRAAFGILRDAKDQNAATRLEIVHLNEVSTTAHLLEFDSVHGRFIESAVSSITVDGRRMSFSSSEEPGSVDWELMVVKWSLNVFSHHRKTCRIFF